MNVFSSLFAVPRLSCLELVLEGRRGVTTLLTKTFHKYGSERGGSGGADGKSVRIED